MINWCAYCQTYQGEVPPLDSWDISHGLCPQCLARDVPGDLDAMQAIAPVANFFKALRAKALKGFSTPGNVILEEAATLGIRPLELMVGLLQPALEEIGQAWARGQVSAAVEHRFSAMVESVVMATLHRQYAERAVAPSASPEFLVVNADGNFHTLGARVVEAFLLSHGRSVTAFVPGLPAAEVIAQVRSLRPRTLGISVAAPAQLEFVREVCAGLGDQRPRVVVGGSAVRALSKVDAVPGVQFCTHLQDLLVAP